MERICRDELSRGSTVVDDDGDRQIHLRTPLLNVTSTSPPTERRHGATYKDIVFPPWLVGGKRGIYMNHNVFLNFVLAILYGLSESLWAGTVTSAYIKKLGRGRNRPLGNIEAANGMAELCSAIPVGYLADTIGKSKVIAAGGWLIALTAILHFLMVQWIGIDEINAPNHKGIFYILGAIYACWGVASGVVEGPTEALYADSVPEGKRSKYYVYLYNSYNLASCLGPLVSIILFQTVGNKWDFYHLSIILKVGLVMEIFNAIVMMLFDDKKSLDEEDESDEEEEEEEEENGTIVATVNVMDSDENSDDENIYYNDEDAQESFFERMSRKIQDALISRRKYIPHVVFINSLVWSVGEGISVEFFPLFFKDDLKMSPTQVQSIYFILPIILTGVSIYAEKVASRGFGRAHTVFVLNVVGVISLYMFIILKFYVGSHPAILIPFYIIKISTMEACSPLEESIMMDFAPRDQRSMWMSLESISTVGWCGSAALGGYLSDKFGYSQTFLLTAILQTFNCVLCIPLLFMVPRKEGREYRRNPAMHVSHNAPRRNPPMSATLGEISSSSSSSLFSTEENPVLNEATTAIVVTKSNADGQTMQSNLDSKSYEFLKQPLLKSE